MQKIPENTVFDDRRDLRGNAFVIKWTRTEPRLHKSIVDDGHVGRSDSLPDLIDEKRASAINRTAGHSFEDMTQQRTRTQRVEDHGDLASRNLARSQAP